MNESVIQNTDDGVEPVSHVWVSLTSDSPVCPDPQPPAPAEFLRPHSFLLRYWLVLGWGHHFVEVCPHSQPQDFHGWVGSAWTPWWPGHWFSPKSWKCFPTILLSHLAQTFSSYPPIHLKWQPERRTVLLTLIDKIPCWIPILNCTLTCLECQEIEINKNRFSLYIQNLQNPTLLPCCCHYDQCYEHESRGILEKFEGAWRRAGGWAAAGGGEAWPGGGWRSRSRSQSRASPGDTHCSVLCEIEANLQVWSQLYLA